MSMLEQARELVFKSRAKLITGTKTKAAKAHLEVGIDEICDLRLKKGPLSHKDIEAEAARTLRFLEEKCRERWVDYCRHVDLLNSIERKGWN